MKVMNIHAGSLRRPIVCDWPDVKVLALYKAELHASVVARPVTEQLADHPIEFWLARSLSPGPESCGTQSRSVAVAVRCYPDPRKPLRGPTKILTAASTQFWT